jgi:hypothetical protein
MPKKKSNLYFTEETEDKILEYIDEPSQIKRDIIYSKYLHKPIRTIAEVMHSKLSVDYIQEDREDAINDCISFLMTEAIYYLKKGKGKAYSYLTVSARNHYIQLNRKEYVKLKRRKDDMIADDVKDYMVDESYDNKQYNKDFLSKYYDFISWCRKEIHKLAKQEKTIKNILIVLDYMEGFESQSMFKKDILQELFEFSGKSSKTNILVNERSMVYEFYLFYTTQWEKGNKNPNILKTMRNRSHLSPSEILWAKQKHKKQSHQWGYRSLAARLNVDEQTVKYYLTK